MLLDFSAKYPDSEKPLESWWTICKKNNFSSFNELKKTSNKRMTELAEKALASGAINLESWEDDYRLPKVVMTAVCSSLEWDWLTMWHFGIFHD